MDLASLTEFLVKSVVSNTEDVSVKQLEDEKLITIEVLVNSDDMGKVIGKGGSIIKSIRTIVQASSILNNERKVRVNIDSY